ncbi:hypothetical protein VULLAG_LOCUS18243 [Vulpes lagopus]
MSTRSASVPNTEGLASWQPLLLHHRTSKMIFAVAVFCFCFSKEKKDRTLQSVQTCSPEKEALNRRRTNGSGLIYATVGARELEES